MSAIRQFGHDCAQGGGRIGRARDRAPHDEEIGAVRDGGGRRGHPPLVIPARGRGADPRRDRERRRAERRSQPRQIGSGAD
jgi:hypothetical protein